MPTSYGVTLTRSEPTTINVWGTGAYRLHVEASDPVGFDGRVFLYRRLPTDPAGNILDRFVGVASPQDLDSVPVDAPDTNNNWPMFRQSVVELDATSTNEATQYWNNITSSVTVLVEALKRLDALNVVEEVRVGDPA